MDKFSYEDAVARLEKIAETLEKGELNLEEMIKLYSEGIKLSDKCSKALEEAQLIIKKISGDGSDE